MTPYPVKGSSLPIPFHRLMKVVVIANSAHPQLGQLLECLRAEHFELEVSDSYERDVTEDAAVGAYIALVDGDRREPARQLAKAVREAGFRTPLWALADSHRIADMAVLALTGEVDGYIYLGQQTPAFYAKQVDREPRRVRHAPAAAVLRRADGLRRRGQHRLRLPRPPGRPVLPQVARRPAVLQALRREHLPQRPVQRRRRPRRSADPRGRGRARRSSTRRRCSAPTGPTSC